MDTSRYRALVVDDEQPIRQLVQRALAAQGIACDQAADGHEALKQCHSRAYDAVITDLRMPNRHGHALCVDLLASTDRPIIVVLTGVMDPRLTRDLMARGVDDIVFKPVDFRAFSAKIKLLLESRPGQTSCEKGPTSGSKLQDPQPREHEARESSSGRNHQQDRPEAKPTAPNQAESRPEKQTERHASSASAEFIVLVQCRAPQCAEQLSRMIASDDVEAAACQNSEQLHRRLREQHVDVVIIEHRLDGFLSGLDVLEKMHTDLLRPDAILIGELDEDEMERAEQLGIEVIVPANTSNDVIVASAQRLMHARTHSESPVPPQARKLVDLYEDIPVLPQLLTRLLTYLDVPSEEIDLKKLAKEISVDARATAEILRLTNSSTLGVGQRVVRVLDAVNLLGPKRTISLVLNSATMHAQSELLKGWSQPLRQWYQRRSVLVASVASIFAKKLERVSPNTAFTLGLLQDVGVLVLANRGKERYVQSILERARTIGSLELSVLETQAYKTNHAEVSAAVLDRWKLPQSLVTPVLFHHRQDDLTECDATEKAFLRVMRIGEALANVSDVPHGSRRMRLNNLFLHYGVKQKQTCKESVEAALAKTAEACELFSLPVPEPDDLYAILQNVVQPASEDDEPAAEAESGN